MWKRVRRRYLDLLASIYIYNEHRGYTALDRVLEGVRACAPDDQVFLALVEKHRRDERKHYLMFQRWFERRGVMPYAVGRTCGHIDRFVEIVFGKRIDALDTKLVAGDHAQFERLCRVISLTEQRGYRQLGILLGNRFVRSDRALVKIFRIIERDEPSHWAPYEGWLRQHGRRPPNRRERMIDTFIHSELLFLKLPVLFLRFGLKRRTDWADSATLEEAPPTPANRAEPAPFLSRAAQVSGLVIFYAALAGLLQA